MRAGRRRRGDGVVSVIARVRAGALAVSVVAGCLVAGCTCSEEPRDRPRPARGTEGSTEGGDEGRLSPVSDPALAPQASRFVLIEMEEGAEAARARSWIGADAVRRGSEGDDREDPGNWLCRLTALYGAPPGITDHGFRYVLRDTELDYVLVAYLDERGPSMGAVITNEEGHRIGDEDRIARSVDDFVRLVDATRPVDCELIVDGQRIGVEGERPL